MKFLILLACTLAASSAAYLGPLHIPVIGPNGVPVEPHEVQAARANHLAAVASAHGGGYASTYYTSPVAAPYAAHGVPTFGHNALPLDTPEVASAKIQHYRDFSVAAQRNGVHVPLISSPHVGIYNADTPEVQLAKAAHFQAHAEAAARSVHYRRRRDVYGGYHIPVIGPNGVPVETPEVQAARASHLAALAEASSRGGAEHYDYSGDNSGAYTPAAYSEPYHRYYGPQATIGPDGRPVETPEVQAAKAYHFSAYNAALTGNHLGNPGHYY